MKAKVVKKNLLNVRKKVMNSLGEIVKVKARAKNVPGFEIELKSENISL